MKTELHGGSRNTESGKAQPHPCVLIQPHRAGSVPVTVLGWPVGVLLARSRRSELQDQPGAVESPTRAGWGQSLGEEDVWGQENTRQGNAAALGKVCSVVFFFSFIIVGVFCSFFFFFGRCLGKEAIVWSRS